MVISVTIYATVKDIFSNSQSDNDQNKDENAENQTENEEKENENGEKNEPDGNDFGYKLCFIVRMHSSCIHYLFLGNENSLVKAFSLKQTTGKLLSEANEDGDIECIHGIRALTTIALYIAHKLIPIGMMSFTNRGFLTEVYSPQLRKKFLKFITIYLTIN